MQDNDNLKAAVDGEGGMVRHRLPDRAQQHAGGK